MPQVSQFVRALVYSGLTPQQQPGSCRGGDYDDNDDEMTVSLVEETGALG